MSATSPEFLDALKEFAYGASHEINNPLANIAARAQTLHRDEPDPERRRALEAIHQQALRAHEMISDLMLFARPPRLERQSVDLASLLTAVESELSAECLRREAALNIDVDPALPPAAGDFGQLTVAVKALVVNALEAVGRGARVDVTASLADDGEFVQIVVRDNGPGIPPRVRPHIFDPFYSGREAGRGLGFGLSKCWRIVTAHGGELDVADLTSGAEFTVTLPLNAAAN